jgi:hypothetical protein
MLGDVKLTDFGLSVAGRERNTHAGTFSYIPYLDKNFLTQI